MQYTTLNIGDLRQILSEYGVGSVESFKLLSGGSENSNFEVKTSEGKYVLTICEQKSMEETHNLASLLEHLTKHDFSTSRVCKTREGAFVSSFAGKPVLVKSFIEGKIMADLPAHLLTIIGRELGKLHKIDAPDYLPTSISYGREHFHEVAGYAPDSEFYTWLQDTEAYAEPKLSLDLPKSLIHSDLFFSNVIVSDAEDKVAIMDFEEATYLERVFDVGMAIVGLCAKEQVIDLAKVSALLSGYVEEVDLTRAEKESLQVYTVYAAASMCFWRHMNFNYSRPDPKQKDRYLELKEIADFVRVLPKESFIGIISG